MKYSCALARSNFSSFMIKDVNKSLLSYIDRQHPPVRVTRRLDPPNEVEDDPIVGSASCPSRSPLSWLPTWLAAVDKWLFGAWEAHRYESTLSRPDMQVSILLWRWTQVNGQSLFRQQGGFGLSLAKRLRTIEDGVHLRRVIRTILGQ